MRALTQLGRATCERQQRDECEERPGNYTEKKMYGEAEQQQGQHEHRDAAQ
jgi:hypothetical protein